MALTPERKQRARERLFESNIATLEENLLALRLRRKHAADQGNTITADSLDVEIANAERFIERQKLRASEVTAP
jgi:hypothetical protein